MTQAIKHNNSKEVIGSEWFARRENLGVRDTKPPWSFDQTLFSATTNKSGKNAVWLARLTESIQSMLPFSHVCGGGETENTGSLATRRDYCAR